MQFSTDLTVQGAKCILTDMLNRAALRLTPFTLSGKERTWRLVAPEDPDQVLRSLTEAECALEKHQPYWAERWPSAQVLFDFLDTMPMPEGARACELGSGIGACAVLLGSRAARTTAMDISFDACTVARRNIAGCGSAAAAVCADWRHPPFRSGFDIIAGADILYEESAIVPVASCIASLLREGGTAYIADPCRPGWAVFKEKMRSLGLPSRAVHEDLVNEGKTVVEVCEFRRAPDGPRGGQEG